MELWCSSHWSISSFHSLRQPVHVSSAFSESFGYCEPLNRSGISTLFQANSASYPAPLLPTQCVLWCKDVNGEKSSMFSLLIVLYKNHIYSVKFEEKSQQKHHTDGGRGSVLLLALGAYVQRTALPRPAGYASRARGIREEGRGRGRGKVLEKGRKGMGKAGRGKRYTSHAFLFCLYWSKWCRVSFIRGEGRGGKGENILAIQYSVDVSIYSFIFQCILVHPSKMSRPKHHIELQCLKWTATIRS